MKRTHSEPPWAATAASCSSSSMTATEQTATTTKSGYTVHQTWVSRRRIIVASNSRIRAGRVANIYMESGDWFIVDVGFSSRNPTCAFAVGMEPPREVHFRVLVNTLMGEAVQGTSRPLNLLLEAPLSMAFNTAGNPKARDFEYHVGGVYRGWYYQTGASTMLTAANIIDELSKCRLRRRIRLFEGFAPLPGASHTRVVNMLRQVIVDQDADAIVHPDAVITPGTGTVRPIFGIHGRDPKIPPVVCVLPP